MKGYNVLIFWGTLITTIAGSDLGKTYGYNLEKSIPADVGATKFEIDTVTGVVTLKEQVSYDVHQEIVVLFKAIDSNENRENIYILMRIIGN